MMTIITSCSDLSVLEEYGRVDSTDGLKAFKKAHPGAEEHINLCRGCKAVADAETRKHRESRKKLNQSFKKA